jgi:hypothetical protein
MGFEKLRLFAPFERLGMSKDFLRNRLDEMIDLKHPLASRLALGQDASGA